ncbi:MAG: hypothetical protein ACRCWR_09280, partial [Saezia sp.]
MSYTSPDRPSQKERKKRLPLWLHWWYQLPVSQQDRIFALTPIMALAVFISFVLLSYSYLNKQQNERESINARQSVATVEQQLRLLMIDNENKLQNIAYESIQSHNPKVMFLSQSSTFLNQHPEIVALYWHDVTNG